MIWHLEHFHDYFWLGFGTGLLAAGWTALMIGLYLQHRRQHRVGRMARQAARRFLAEYEAEHGEITEEEMLVIEEEFT